MRYIVKLFIIAAVLTCLRTAGATVPDLIPVQGVLTNSANGEPVDGLTDMRFDIFAAETGGTAPPTLPLPGTLSGGS